MKSQYRAVLTLIALFGASPFVAAAEQDAIACCLASEWIAEDAVSESAQIDASESAQSDASTCCLAKEWRLSDAPVLAAVEKKAAAPAHAADAFCCIAAEWKVR